MREDSFFSTDNDIDPARARLMIVDQDTGHISFIHKSLADLNTSFTSESIQIEDALKKLFGENIRGDNIPSEFLQSGNDGILKKLGDAVVSGGSGGSGLGRLGTGRLGRLGGFGVILK